ncbi:MAG: hypothetical protein NT116_00425 [Candidatus Parcubacteria bacterium]|nr:hypothetical protein [Candidatus Parcubacteria bacterium]
MSYDQLTDLIKRISLKKGDNSDLRFDLEQYGEADQFNLIGKEPDEQRYKNTIKRVAKKLFSQNPDEDDLLAIVCYAPTLKKQAWQRLKPQMDQNNTLKSGMLKQIIKAKAPMPIRKDAAEILVKGEKSLLKTWRKSTKNLKGIPKNPEDRKEYFECLKMVQAIKEDLKLILESNLPQQIKKAAAQELFGNGRAYETHILLLIKKHVPSLRNKADIMLSNNRGA